MKEEGGGRRDNERKEEREHGEAKEEGEGMKEGGGGRGGGMEGRKEAWVDGGEDGEVQSKRGEVKRKKGRTEK